MNHVFQAFIKLLPEKMSCLFLMGFCGKGFVCLEEQSDRIPEGAAKRHSGINYIVPITYTPTLRVDRTQTPSWLFLGKIPWGPVQPKTMKHW